MFTNKALKNLIIPLVIEQILVMTVGMFDTMMVSHAGEASISGVALVDMLDYLIITIFAALATGGAVIVSQYLGSRQRDRANSSAGQLITISFFLSLAVMVLCLVFHKGILKLLFGGIEPDVMEACVTYFVITAFSFPFLGIYNASAALFRSMQKTNVTMLVAVLMNVINIAGNAIGIFVLKAGVAGVAVSTLIARAVAAINLAIITVVGQCVGAGEIEQSKQYTKKLMKISYLTTAVLGIGICFSIPLILRFYELSDEAYRYSCILIVMHNLLAILLHPTSFNLANSLRAAGNVRFTMIVGIGSMLLFCLGSGVLFGIILQMGVIGVWIAMGMDWLARSVVFTLRYKSGKWKTINVINKK